MGGLLRRRARAVTVVLVAVAGCASERGGFGGRDLIDPVEVLAPDDIYAYLGDGGDYLYIDHWVTGESLADATERFEEGVAAMEGCDDISARQVDISHPDVDDVRRYESPEGGTDEYSSLVYARNGGVVMLLFVNTLSPERYDHRDVDHLVTVALDKLASIGRVEVPG